jgi:hypothetical protein
MLQYSRCTSGVILLALAACPPLRNIPAAAPPPDELARHWSQLASPDATVAYAAITWLADRPRKAIPYLRTRLRPIAHPDSKRLARFIADLDSPDFATRTKASRELQTLADLAEPALQTALKGKPSLEQRKRIDKLLRKLDEPIASPETLRHIRAVEPLERMATPQARQLLAVLAKGAPGAWLTREARESLDRLSPRKPGAP